MDTRVQIVRFAPIHHSGLSPGGWHSGTLVMEASGVAALASTVPPPGIAVPAEKGRETEEGSRGTLARGSDAPHDGSSTPGDGKDAEAPRKQNGNGADTEGSSDTRGSGNTALSPALSFPQTPGWEESEGSRRRTESPLGEAGENGRLAGSPRAAAARKRQFRGFKRSPEACMALIREVLLRKPFSYGHVGPGWAAVADSLNSSFPDLFPPASDGTLPCTADNCRSAFDRIMDSWEKKGRVEDRMNGMEYDYSEWNQILGQIHVARHARKTLRDDKSGRSQPSSGGAAGAGGAGGQGAKRPRLGNESPAAVTLGGDTGHGLQGLLPPLVAGGGEELGVVDLRSDTVTRPTPEMRQAMMDAEVGDDVFGDDPTVAELEALTANMFEKQAGLLVPSGTMGNLIAVMAHCERRGSEMIVGMKNHLVVYEQGGLSTVAAVHPRQLKTQTEHGAITPVGGIALADIEESIRNDDVHLPVTRLVCLENAHNMCGGVALPADYIDAVGELCRRRSLKLHIDGARIFNAAAALNTSVARLCKAADSVSCCLSKGLAAPVGSVLVGSEEFIKRARRHRKVLGGGMRQAGVIAACGLISLRTMSKRLLDDHANARRLAEGLNSIAGVDVDLNGVHTNLVYFKLQGGGAHKLVAMLGGRGILMAAKDERTVRAVCHYMVSTEACDRAVAAVREMLPAINS